LGEPECTNDAHALVIHCASAASPGRVESGFCVGSGFENTYATSWKWPVPYSIVLFSGGWSKR
jgi:hypothetical protein